ncbi:MAG: cytochrome c maturation protein CcmE [Polyangiaceae bacterium]
MSDPRGHHVDDELAQALADTDAEAAAQATDVPGLTRPVAPAARARTKSLGLLITLLAMVAGIVCLILFGINSGAVYSMNIDELMSTPGKYVGRKVRLEGGLVPGTLVKRDKPCEYRFTIQGANQKVPVQYPQCVVADSFVDVPQGGVEVTVEGKLNAAGTFEASLVMAKCTSKYDAEKHEMKATPGLAPSAGPLSVR